MPFRSRTQVVLHRSYLTHVILRIIYSSSKPILILYPPLKVLEHLEMVWSFSSTMYLRLIQELISNTFMSPGYHRRPYHRLCFTLMITGNIYSTSNENLIFSRDFRPKLWLIHFYGRRFCLISLNKKH